MFPVQQIEQWSKRTPTIREYGNGCRPINGLYSRVTVTGKFLQDWVRAEKTFRHRGEAALRKQLLTKHYGQGKLVKVVPKNPRDPMVQKYFEKLKFEET